MKKIVAIIALSATLIVGTNCGAKKKVATKAPRIEAEKVMQYTYTKDIAPILKASCTPCHFPPDGRKEALHNYATVKTHIAEIIVRVKLPKYDNGFMPFMGKKPALTDSAINVLAAWQKGGMVE